MRITAYNSFIISSERSQKVSALIRKRKGYELDKTTYPFKNLIDAIRFNRRYFDAFPAGAWAFDLWLQKLL